MHKTSGKKKSKNPHKGFLFFFSPGTKGPRVYKELRFQGDWEHKCCGHSSFSFQILCLQSYFCCLWTLRYQSHKHIESKKSERHSILGFKLQANLYSQQFLLSSSSFVLRSSIHWSVWKKGEFLLFGLASQVHTTF